MRYLFLDQLQFCKFYCALAHHIQFESRHGHFCLLMDLGLFLFLIEYVHFGQEMIHVSRRRLCNRFPYMCVAENK